MTKPKQTNAQKWGKPVQLSAYCQGCGGGPRALYPIVSGPIVIAKRCGECMGRIAREEQGVFEQRHKRERIAPGSEEKDP